MTADKHNGEHSTVSAMAIPPAEHPPLGAGLRVLLTDSKRWAVGVRIGMVFAEMGCEVAMLCPAEGHPAATVRSIHHRFPYSGFHTVASLRAAIRQFRPDLILPTCDRGVGHLHRLHSEARACGDYWITGRIERSLGPAESYRIVSNRYELLKLAREEGILIPQTIALGSESDLAGAEKLGLPLVIKADGTWGGCGVKVALSRAELRCAFQSLRGRRGIPRLIRELALNRDRGNTLQDWWNARPALIAQSWIDGRPGNCAVACWNGKVLAGICVEAVATNGDRGPASVIEIVEGRQMTQAAERIARRLNLSGFFGLDFMVERETGAAYLIEMNPRCTQPCSLTLDTGRNLPAAICAQLAGRPEPETASVTTLSRIAYFPQPAGRSARPLDLPVWSYYYDIPPDEPEFVHLLLNQWPDRGRLGQWLDRMRGIDRGTAMSRGRAAGSRDRKRLRNAPVPWSMPLQGKDASVLNPTERNP